MTITRVRRTLFAAAAGAALTLSAAGPAAAAGLPDPKTSKNGDKTTIVVITDNDESTYTPKGGKPGPFPEDENFVPGVGDVTTDSVDYLQNGVKVGSDDGTCTVTKVVETAVTLDCDATAVFASGTLELDFDVTFDLAEEDEEGEVFTVPIVGGTGAYQGATGTASAREVENADGDDDDFTDELTFVFTTGGSQVTQTPNGGSQSGATRELNGLDAGLLGLGAAAIGGGAVLLTARSRVARRLP